MTYLFEDKDSDILSEFFKLGYKQSDSIKFIGGNASFKRSINRTIKDGDSVAIFLTYLLEIRTQHNYMTV